MDIHRHLIVTTTKRPERGVIWKIELLVDGVPRPIGSLATSAFALSDAECDTLQTLVMASLECLVEYTIPGQGLSPF